MRIPMIIVVRVDGGVYRIHEGVNGRVVVTKDKRRKTGSPQILFSHLNKIVKTLDAGQRGHKLRHAHFKWRFWRAAKVKFFRGESPDDYINCQECSKGSAKCRRGSSSPHLNLFDQQLLLRSVYRGWWERADGVRLMEEERAIFRTHSL